MINERYERAFEHTSFNCVKQKRRNIANYVANKSVPFKFKWIAIATLKIPIQTMKFDHKFDLIYLNLQIQINECDDVFCSIKWSTLVSKSNTYVLIFCDWWLLYSSYETPPTSYSRTPSRQNSNFNENLPSLKPSSHRPTDKDF